MSDHLPSGASTASAPSTQDTLPGFSREQLAALHWALGRKEKEPSKVSCFFLFVTLSLFSLSLSACVCVWFCW